MAVAEPEGSTPPKGRPRRVVLCQHLIMTPDDVERVLAALEAGTTVTDWISALSTLFTAVVAGAALWFASGQIKEARAARDQARALEIERAQPYVVAYTEQSAATNLATELVIKNFGQTAARDVRIHLEPWPRRDHETNGDDRVGIPELPILAPGQQWRTSWSWGPDRHESDLPKRHEGELRYYGIGQDQLTSPVILDLGIYESQQWIETRSIHDVGQSLRDIQATVKKWTEGQQGLSVYTRSGDERDDVLRAQREEILRRRQTRANAAEAPRVASADEVASVEEGDPGD